METDGHSLSHKHTSWPEIFQYSVYRRSIKMKTLPLMLFQNWHDFLQWFYAAFFPHKMKVNGNHDLPTYNITK